MTVLHVAEVLLFRIWAWVSAKDGSMIWDESRRTVLQSHQRVLVLKRTADLQGEIPCKGPELVHIRVGFLGQAH